MVRARRRATGNLHVHRRLAVGEPVFAHEAFAHALECVDRRRLERDANPGESPRETRGMCAPLEDPAVDDAHDLVDAVAENEAAILDGDRRAFLRNELTIQVDSRHDQETPLRSAVLRSISRAARTTGTASPPAGLAPPQARAVRARTIPARSTGPPTGCATSR